MAINMEELYTQSPGIERAEAQPAAEASTAGTETRDAVASTVGSGAEQAFNGYTATTQDVDPNALADVQATKILGQDSPLMQRARQEGLLTAGRRGLQNTSIAVGTAQGAMADRAIPLAQQNAASYLQQGLANQAAENRAAEVSAGFQQERDVLNAQLETAVSQGNAAAENAARQQLADLETRVSMQTAEIGQQTALTNAAAENEMRSRVMQANTDLNKQFLAGTQAMDLATIQGQYNQLISTNETAARLYDSYFNSISASMANSDLAPDRIAQYVNVQQSMLEAGLRMMDQMNTLNLDTALPGATALGTGKKSTIAPGGTLSATAPIAPTGGAGPTATPTNTNTSGADDNTGRYWEN